MKRKFYAVAVLLMLTMCLMAMSNAIPMVAAESSDFINVYNWGEYIADGSDGSININEEFEAATGIHVNYTNYSSNEDLYAKLKSGGAVYDIVIPSDYMVARLIREDLLQTINFDNVPNYVNIIESYKDLYFDPKNEYSVPYNCGSLGLIYNTTVVKETPTSWDIMWDEQYKDKILMINNPRDAFAVAQFSLGISINTEDNAEWDKAAEKLKELNPLLQSYVMDEVFNKMESGEAAIAPYYAGDFLSMYENNPDLAFIYPAEGTNIFVDSICIPKNAQNKAGAEAYINFLLSHEIALANAEYLYYTSPNALVVNDPEYSLNGNEIVYPSDEVKSSMEYYHDLNADTLKYMNDLWDTVKVGNSNSTLIYVGIGVVVVLIAAYAALRIAVKKQKEAYMR